MYAYKVNLYIARQTKGKNLVGRELNFSSRQLHFTSQFSSRTTIGVLHRTLVNRMMIEAQKDPSLLYSIEANMVLNQHVVDLTVSGNMNTVLHDLINLIEREEVRHMPAFEIGSPHYEEFVHITLSSRGDEVFDREMMQRIFEESGNAGEIILQKESFCVGTSTDHLIQLLIGGPCKSLYSLSKYTLDPLFRKHGLSIETLNLLPFDVFCIREKVAIVSSIAPEQLWIDDITTSKNGRSHQIRFQDGNELLTVTCDLRGMIRSYKCS